jgi:hypothetical protein
MFAYRAAGDSAGEVVAVSGDANHQRCPSGLRGILALVMCLMAGTEASLLLYDEPRPASRCAQ